jgi:hypothetical protein
MKELQAGIELVKTKYIQFNRSSGSKKKVKSVDIATNAAQIPSIRRSLTQSVPVRPPQLLLPSFSVRSSLEKLRHRTTKGIRRLEDQAKRINRLSAELETAVLELKAIASEINPDWKALQATQNPTTSVNICEYQITAVPQIKLRADGSFLLISKPVDLFQAEREATLLAQTLRHRARKKQKLTRKDEES